MVTVERDGSLTFRVYLPHARSVELVADFTAWGTGRLALKRECAPGDESVADAEPGQCCEGWWTITTQAPDGDHAFSYLIDEQWWLPDYAAHGVRRNEHGHWTSLLFVPPKPSILERLRQRRSPGHGLLRSA